MIFSLTATQTYMQAKINSVTTIIIAMLFYHSLRNVLANSGIARSSMQSQPKIDLHES